MFRTARLLLIAATVVGLASLLAPVFTATAIARVAQPSR